MFTKKCSFIPLCMGGCFYQAYIEKGTPFEIVCPADFYKKIWLRIKAKIYEKLLESKDLKC